MADELPNPESPPEQLNNLVTEFVEQFHDVQKLGRWERLIANGLQIALTTVIGITLKMAAKIGAFLGQSIADAEGQEQEAFNELAAVAIMDMFNVPKPNIGSARGRGGNKAAADAIGGALLQAFGGAAGAATGTTGQLQPTDAPAKAFLSAMSQLALEGWLEGWLVEALSLGQMETFGELDDTISHVLGLGRASAAVHGPLVRHMIVEPLEWLVSKEHRPTLLNASTAIRQFQRGRWDWVDVLEELARQGYSDERIDALLNEQRKFLSVDDVHLLANREGSSSIDPMEYLGDAGYDQEDAKTHLLAADVRKLDSEQKRMADAILAALNSGDLDIVQFHTRIDRLSLSKSDTTLYHALGDLRSEINRTPLSDGDAQQAVKRGIQSFAWYRAYLERRGYDQDAVDTKELLLRAELDQAATAAQLKAAQHAEQLAAKAAADQARAERVAQKAAADALPGYAEIRKAFVRGLVGLDRLQAAIAAAHPGIAPADAAALANDAQLDHETYLAQQAAHAAALAADQDKALPLATLEQSVLRGITSIEQYDRELQIRHYGDEQRRVLVALLRGRLDDQAAARQAKIDAEARARAKRVSAADFERATRLGLRTIDQYGAFLDTIDTPDVQKALLLDLLRADMQKDSEARAKRDAADKAAAARSINLPLRRRAVLKGVRTIEQYSDDLVAAGLGLEDRTIELDLTRVEAEAAAAARERAAQLEADRAAKEAQTPEPTLTLAQTEHAVKLGILSPDDLRAYLAAHNYSDADIETLVSTIVASIPDLRQAQQTQTTATAALKAKGLDLAALERAVARGLRTLDEYAAELTARGYGADDVALLRELLAEKVAIDLDGLRKKVTAALAAIPNGPTIAELEAALVDGSVDVAALSRFLTTNGVARDVALVYLRLVPFVGATPAPGGSA